MTRPIVFEDLLRMRRAGQPAASPDGEWVVFPATRPDPEKNRNVTHLYRVPAAGGDVVQLTHRGSRNADPAFSPDGSWIAFTSDRSGTSQVWVMPVDGGEPRPVTQLPTGARGPVWFPDGKRLLAVSPVFPGVDDPEEIQRMVDEDKSGEPRPHTATELMYRHWDAWSERSVDHLFVVDVQTGKARDLTPESGYPVPPRSLSSAPEYAVSPDGKEICFVSLRDPQQAVSTNLNLWTVPAEGGELTRVSPGPGGNTHPVYSPDGTRIAYTAMPRAGYEADQNVLTVLDRASGEVRAVWKEFPLSAGAPAWMPDGERLLFAAQDAGRTRLFAIDAAGGEPEALTGEATDGSPVVAGDRVVFTRELMTAPSGIASMRLGSGKVEMLTDLNREVLAGLDLPESEDFWFSGAKGESVHGMLLRPPGFDPKKKYPVVFLIHGGPQSMFGLDFHERWNTQLFAAPGFVTVSINPRGSTGYGQKFTDAIRGQWGGDCYRDLMNGCDHVLENFAFCDPERTAAAGASFGGFMVNWINGQTDRFRTLVCHDGIFNTEMMEWATDELWFTEWEFGGLPWEGGDEYTKWSPHRHVRNMKTPMLIIHGEQDFRCLTVEGTALFTALRRMDVPAKLLYLPDEGHWVLKPKNREVWYATVLDWLKEYLEP